MRDARSNPHGSLRGVEPWPRVTPGMLDNHFSTPASCSHSSFFLSLDPSLVSVQITESFEILLFFSPKIRFRRAGNQEEI